MKQNQAKEMALCGVMAALAVVIMCMGTLIPLATFICPMLCMVTLCIVLRLTGTRMAWAWYLCVGILSVLLAPDKEAAAVFVFLGYYPIIKPVFDRGKLAFLWKLLYFNAAVLLMYGALIYVFGMTVIAAEFAEMGRMITVITLLLGNVCMILLDVVLSRVGRMK